MVSRRKQTSLPMEQPVRFYKVVALTFLFLTLVLFGAVIFMSSKRAVITIETKAAPVDINNDMVVGENVDNPQIVAVVTTTLVIAEKKFFPTGNKDEIGRAEGTVTLHNETGASQPLVATTRVLSEAGVLFRLKKAVTVPAQGTVVAEVAADQEGSQGDIDATRFTIPGLPEAKQKVIYATSEQAMTGGVRKIGILSEADIDEAEKSLNASMEEQVKTELGKIYPGKEVVFLIGDIEKKLNAKVGDIISSGVLEGKSKVSIVVYDKEEIKNWAEKTIQSRAVGDTQIIRSSNADPKVTLKEYDEEKNQAVLHIFSAGVAALNPASKELEKNVFFGKTKDEVKRYITLIEHVNSVDIDFQPFWMQTVPHIHDHVQVIIKEVQ